MNLLSKIRDRRKMLLLFISLILGVSLTMIVYPGIFYSDSYGRWSLAKAFIAGQNQLLDDWLSFPPQLFMALNFLITGEYSLFTIIQSTLFFFVSFQAIDYFVGAKSLFAKILFAVTPVFWGISI